MNLYLIEEAIIQKDTGKVVHRITIYYLNCAKLYLKKEVFPKLKKLAKAKNLSYDNVNSSNEVVYIVTRVEYRDIYDITYYINVQIHNTLNQFSKECPTVNVDKDYYYTNYKKNQFDDLNDNDFVIIDGKE